MASLSVPTTTPFHTLVTPICQSPSRRSVTSGPSSPWSPWPGSQLPTRQSSSSAGRSGSISSAQSKQTEKVDYSSEPTISSLPQSVDLSDTVVQPCPSNRPEGLPIVQFDSKSCLQAQSDMLTPLQMIGTEDYQWFLGRHSGNRVWPAHSPNVSARLFLDNCLTNACSWNVTPDHGSSPSTRLVTPPPMPWWYVNCGIFLLCQYNGGCKEEMDHIGGEVQEVVMVP